MADANVVVRLSALSNTKGVADFEKGLKRVDGVAKKLGKVLAGVFAVATVKKIVNVHSAIDKQADQIASLTGSAVVASLRMHDLSNAAKETEFTADQMTNAFIALKSVGLDPTVQGMKDLSAFASFAGSDIQTVGKALERASMGRMRRLSELLGTPVKMDGDRVFAEINGQLVESEEGVKGFMKELKRIQGEDWLKAQERGLNSFRGQMNKLRDVGVKVAQKVAEGFAGDLPQAVAKVVDTIERMMPTFELIGKVMGNLLDIADVVFGGISDLLGDWELSFGEIEDWVTGIVLLFGAFKVGLLVPFVKIVALMASKFALAALALGPIPLIIGAIIALGALLVKWLRSDSGKTFIDKAMQRIKGAIEWVKDAFVDIKDRMIDAFKKATDAAKNAFKAVKDAIVGQVEYAMQLVDGIVGNYFRAIISLLKGDFSGFAEYMKDSFMAVFGFLLDRAGSLLGMVDKAAGLIGVNTDFKGRVDNMVTMAPSSSTSGMTQTTSNVSSSVGSVQVNIEGSTNMGAKDVGRSVSKGVDDAIGRQTRKLQHSYAGT